MSRQRIVMSGILKTSDPAANRWLVSAAVIGGVLLGLTFVGQTLPALEKPLEPFNLGRESALAAWFASAWLLWSSLLFLSLAFAVWRQHRVMAAVFVVMAGGGLALCIDESGSLHERVNLILPASLNLSLKKIGLIGAVPLGLSLLAWWKHRRVMGGGWLPAALAYLAFASVAVQELIEQRTSIPEWIAPARTTFEEGTELLGFYLLSWAAIQTALRLQAQQPQMAAELPRHGAYPTPRATSLVFALAALLAPLFILWRLRYDPAEMMSLSYHGDFASAVIMVIYLAAGWACLWRAQHGGPRRAWHVLAISMVCLSMLNIWHPYAHYAGVQIKGDFTADRLRAFYDMIWALLLYLVVSLWFGPKESRSLWGLVILVVVYAAVVWAAVSDSLKGSYAASYLAAVGVGGWTLCLALSARASDHEQAALSPNRASESRGGSAI